MRPECRFPQRIARGSRPARSRGVALVLVIIAVIVAGTVGYSYIGTQSTSVSIARNVQDHARARYIAETGLEIALASIRDNPAWRTQRPSGVWLANQSLAGGTYSIVGQDGLDLDNDGQVEGDSDLTDDPAEPLTLTVTGQINGSSHRARAVVRPVPGDVPLLAYGEQNRSFVRYRTWTGSTWSAEESANNVGVNPKWFLVRTCPTRVQVAVASLDESEDMKVQFYNGSAWSSLSTLISGNTVTSSERPIDIAYEQSSGDLLVAYRLGSDRLLRYRTYDGSTLSNEFTLTMPGTGNPRWIRLMPKPLSNEILAVTLTGSRNICASVWNGSAWGNTVLLEGDASTAGDEQITAAYEGLSGTGMVAWSQDGLAGFQYRTWNGSVWSPESNGPALPQEPRWLKMAADPISDLIVLGTLDGGSRINLVVWNGASWGAPLTAEATASATDRRCFDIAFENAGAQALALWGRMGQNNCFYRIWNGSTWSNEKSGPGLSDKVSVAQLSTGVVPDQIFATILQKGTGALRSMTWNGTSLSSAVQLESNCSGPNSTESFMVSASAGGGMGAGTTYVVDWQ